MTPSMRWVPTLALLPLIAVGTFLAPAASCADDRLDEYVVKNLNGSVKERISKNPLTGQYDIIDKSGKRTGTISPNSVVPGEFDRKDMRGRVIERYEKRQ